MIFFRLATDDELGKSNKEQAKEQVIRFCPIRILGK